MTVDITAVRLEELSADRIRVSGARGKAPPPTLKVTLSADGGWLAEAEVSYAGINALARAKLAASIVRQRIDFLAIEETCRIELLGTGAVHDNDHSYRFEQSSASEQFSTHFSASGEFRVRTAIRSQSKQIAQQVADEVLALYCCGPAGGGGVRQSVTEQVSTASILVDRQHIERHVRAVEVFA